MIKNSKILIVDDEPRLCDSLKTLLCTQNYEVKTCNSGNEALNFLITDAFDLVLLDVFMEGMDGFQVIENIRHQKIDTPVIIMTGNASTESAVKALRMGAKDYLKKPFETEELFKSVGNIINQWKLKQEIAFYLPLDSGLKYQQTKIALKESEDLFSKIFFNSPLAMVITKISNGKCVEANENFSSISGHEHKDILGRTSIEIGFWPNQKDRESVVRILQKENTIKDREIEFLNRSGELRIGKVSIELIKYKGEVCIFTVIDDITEQKLSEKDLKEAQKGREKIIKALQEALERIKTLSGLLPICSSCKKIRDDKGFWNQIEVYIQKHSYAIFTHSMCPECSDKLYGDEDWYIEMKKAEEKKSGQ